MSVETIRAALRVFNTITFNYKQLVGEEGLNDEATGEYQIALIAILAAWVRQNRNLDLDNEIAVDISLAGLQTQLEELADESIPEAFSMGSGSAADPGQIPELGEIVNTNRHFMGGSLIPYLRQEMVLADGLTLGQLAAVRQPAWEARTSLYAGAFWTAIWVGLGVSLINRLMADNQPVRRFLDPGAEHCPTCPPKAREYASWNEMLGFTGGLPADGSDDCQSNCRCQIEVFEKGEWVNVGI